jgi:hypothetical protein
VIVSKNSLSAVHITAKDKDIPALDNLHFEPDGTTVGAAGNVVIVVSPVNEKVANQVPLTNTGTSTGTVNADTIRKTIKLLTPDKTFGGLLEHCDLKVQDGEAKFTFTDGKRVHNMAGRTYPHDYIPWRSILRKSLQQRTGPRVALNRARLHLLLETLEKIAPDTNGQSPVYLEFTTDGDIVARARNNLNGQQVVATMKNYSFKDNAWPHPTPWEEGLENDDGNNTVLHHRRRRSTGPAAARPARRSAKRARTAKRPRLCKP